MNEANDLRRRVASWGWDYLVVLVWLAVVFIAIGIPQLAGWLDLSGIWSRPAAADVAVTCLTVVPYLAYLVVTEAGSTRATLGKQRTRLAVYGPAGHLALWRVVVRNGVKVLPWQLGHMSAMRFAVTEAVTGFAVAVFIASMVVLALVVVPVLLGSRGFHDRAAGTEVRTRDHADRR